MRAAGTVCVTGASGFSDRHELGIAIPPWQEIVLDTVADLHRWGHLQA